MSNASNCRTTAENYALLATRAINPDQQRAYEKLEHLWLEIAPLAESFDRRRDGSAKERIYELFDAVESERRKVARAAPREICPGGEARRGVAKQLCSRRVE